MDALITNLNGTEHKLSDFGFQALNFEESAPTITRTTKSFDGRAGSLDYGGRHVVKKITINGLYWVKSLEQADDVRDKVNAALSQTDPVYLTRVYGGRNLYDVRESGKDFVMPAQTVDKKRFKVYRTDTNLPSIIERTGKGVYYTWSLEFETVELPYGESKPRSQTLVSGQSITYNGTVACSQLEQAFYFVVTAKVASAGGFTLTVDGQSLIVTSPVVAGDVYTLSGMNNTRGNQNINDKTNAGYFVLHPGAANKIVCSISADIQIKNLCDLYI